MLSACSTKVPKEEESEEDKKSVIPMTQEGPASVSVGFHIMGQITTEQLAAPRNHQCEHCDFSAMTDDRVIAHKESKHKIFLCRFCKTNWRTKFMLAEHLSKCDKLIAMREKVKKQSKEVYDVNHTHISIECMHTKVKCPICKVIYKNMFELGNVNLHPCKSYYVHLFQCNGCKIRFMTANGLKSHLISKYSTNDLKCFNAGILSFESTKIPKFKRSANGELDLNSIQDPVTQCLVPIKSEPTLPDEMHNDRTKYTLVAAHLLSHHDGSTTTDYYFAMRRMFYRVNCPYCGIECRTLLGGLHAHGLMHHPPFERCFYQCGGCQSTYRTPSALGQHLKMQFDQSHAECYNTVNLVRKEDYLGPISAWNRHSLKKKLLPLSGSQMFPNTIDVPLDPDFHYEKVVKKEEPIDDEYD